jgi:hypothetical protein
MPDSPASQDDPSREARPAALIPSNPDPAAAVLRFAAELGRLIGRQLAADPKVQSSPRPPRRRAGPRVP